MPLKGTYRNDQLCVELIAERVLSDLTEEVRSTSCVRNGSTIAGEVDDIQQSESNVLTNATKHKETTVHKRFRQILSSSGVRREIDNERRRKQRRGQTRRS